MTKMKSLSRSIVWWPGLDKHIEEEALKCALCQSMQPLTASAPVHPWEFPEKKWHHLNIDFAVPKRGYYGG